MKQKTNKISSLSDESLMAMVRKRDTDAFNELYFRYSGRILNFLYRLWSKDEDMAQDLLQDTFIRIIDKADSFDETKRFSTWLFTIASNLSKNELRRRGIRRDKLKLYVHENDFKYEDKTDKALDKEQLISYLDRQIKKLRPESRELITLRFQEEMAVNEIAAIMEIPEGTVKSRLHHLIKNLSKKLKSKNILDE